MKHKRLLWGVGLIFVAVVVGWLWRNMGNIEDYRLAIVDGEGIELRGWSFDRQMVNVIDIDGEARIWIPGGYGWYRSDTVVKLLEDEKKEYLWGDILFYNFGFDAKKIVKNSENWSLMGGWGWYPWIRYKLAAGEWLEKTEEMGKGEVSGGGQIDRMMQRDMADSQILAEPMRLSIYNTSGENGLAAFVGKNLERMGLTISSWENAETEIDGCEIRIGSGWEKENLERVISKYFKDCRVDDQADLPIGEAEFYFGEKYAQMINYKSYIDGKDRGE